MGKVHFYALWSLHESPRQFIRNVSRTRYQLQIPLPLPKQLIVFSLGDWTSFSCKSTILVEVFVSPEVQPQRIGVLSPHLRCLVWEGEWTLDLLTESTKKRRKGVYAKVLLTVCGKVQTSFISSTPLVKRNRSACDQATSLFQTILSNASNNITSQELLPEDTISYAELKTSKLEIQDISHGVWAMGKPPKRTVIGKGGSIWSYDGPETPPRTIQASSSKKRKLSTTSLFRLENKVVKRTRPFREEHPSKRWHHTMCLCEPDTAVLIGGETADQAHLTDSIWKLEIDGDFWFPMDSPETGPFPPSAQGHSAVFDPEQKVVYVYGGLREGQCYCNIYILDTLSWKWKLIRAKGKVPSLAYHGSWTYKNELYVFGGLQPSRVPGSKACSNALYIFNPKHELWYQPIVEGDRPLPRFGHSTTLLSDKLVIFGGQKTAAYLNDLHILDLGFMEYTAVKYENMPPLARGFHAALPVYDNRVLISGGCSALGALQDLHLFNLGPVMLDAGVVEMHASMSAASPFGVTQAIHITLLSSAKASAHTNCWTSVVCPVLSSKPRAGHSLISMNTAASYTDKRDRGDGHYIRLSTQQTILVFGGSNCVGTFYDDALKCTVELPSEGLGQDTNGQRQIDGD